MNKLLFVLFCSCLTFLYNEEVSAQMKNLTNMAKSSDEISITGYMNYPPIGFAQEYFAPKNDKPYYSFRSVFEDIMQELKENSNLKMTYRYAPNEKDDKFIASINAGEIDIFLGAYYDTKKFQRVELIYPSILNNPVTLITMPETSAQIKNLAQLKDMKGAVCNQDEFSDYVKKQMKEYNLVYVDTPYQLFERLYTGEVDFVFATQYFGIIEASKLGIRDYLSFSKQIIWNMPLFIGISQFSPNRKFLRQKLSSYSERPENKAKLEQKLHDMIQQVELQNRGVVPPAYVKQENQDSVTSSLDVLPQEDKILAE